MIPKIIHYCWFGRNEKSELIQQCISSWRLYLKDYEIREWNEDNFDLDRVAFVRQAYESKKWAFVSDYVRAYALYQIGGIYLDSDVEITNSLDGFLGHRAFSGFEEKGFPFTAVWGAEKLHNWPKQILDYYDGLSEFSQTTNTKIVSDFLVSRYGVNAYEDKLQVLEDGIYIYPSHYFCLRLDKNYAIHHFEGSWIDERKQNYNDVLLKKYYRDNYLAALGNEKLLEHLYHNKLFTLQDLSGFIINRIKRKWRK